MSHIGRFVLASLLALAAPAVTTSAQFHGSTDVVVTNVSVSDRRGKFLTDLPQSTFVVLEDGRPQSIQVFTQEELPATIGLLVDASASVWPIRRRLIDAALAFASATRADDELFVLAFNDRVASVLPPATPFVSNAEQLAPHLERAVLGAGRTAFYDALSVGLDRLAEGTRQRRVLVVIGDGGDNASAATREGVLRRVQASNVVVYAVALRDPDNGDARPEALRDLTEVSGGRTVPSESDRAIGAALRSVADDLRHTYTIGFESDRPPDDALRQIRVVVTPADGQRVIVRARTAYWAARKPAEPASIPEAGQ